MTTNTSTQPQSTYAAYALPGGSTTETGLDRLLAALHRGPFVRSTTNAKVAGVCASIADRTGLAPKVVRIGTIVLAVFGVAVPLYLGAWLLTPPAIGGGRERGAVLTLLLAVKAYATAQRALDLTGGESKAIALAVLFALVVVATLNIPLGWLVIGAVGATAYYGFGVGRSGARSGAAGGRHTEPTPQDAPRW